MLQQRACSIHRVQQGKALRKEGSPRGEDSERDKWKESQDLLHPFNPGGAPLKWVPEERDKTDVGQLSLPWKGGWNRGQPVLPSSQHTYSPEPRREPEVKNPGSGLCVIQPRVGSRLMLSSLSPWAKEFSGPPPTVIKQSRRRLGYWVLISCLEHTTEASPFPVFLLWKRKSMTSSYLALRNLKCDIQFF